MPPLRTAVDVTPAINGATGIARYVTGLSAALDERDDVEAATFAVGRGVHPTPPGARHLHVPLRIAAWSWRHAGPPRVEWLVGPVDTVHASGSAIPSSRAPVVAVVHDLAPLDHPALHPARDVAQARRYLQDLPRAAAVIAVSAATADRLSTEVGTARIHVVPNGITPLPAPRTLPASRPPYLLAVGAPVPRKAYDAALRALHRLPDRDLRLVIVGPAGSEDAALAGLAAELGLTARYHRTGQVDDDALAGWYAGAVAVVAPSIDEGFGLPVLEAQAAGTPVVASDIAAHREVAGGAAMLVAVGDDDALADALLAALDRGTAVKAAIDAGRANAQRYTWAECAAATVAVHRAVLVT